MKAETQARQFEVQRIHLYETTAERCFEPGCYERHHYGVYELVPAGDGGHLSMWISDHDTAFQASVAREEYIKHFEQEGN